MPTHTDGADVMLRLKAVPGASRNAVGGLVGDRLKVRVAAPPEGGRANDAIVELLADRLEVRRSAIQIVVGLASPEKVARIVGLAEGVVRERLGIG